MQNTCTPTRQYFVDSYIEGNVDFIFGDGNSLFENCEIHSTTHNGGYITAQGRHLAGQDSAYVFNHCKLTAEPNVGTVWLGRPWRPYASVVFMNTEMGPHIGPAGRREWHPGETKYLETVFYAEYNSSGPGAHPSERDPHTRHLTATEAARYETKRFLTGPDGWDPTTKR
jgi:pectin methylesterase-like acyl-CoA thioesterase